MKRILSVGLCFFISACSQISIKPRELLIASESKTSNIQPLITAFEEANNVKVTLISKEKANLLELISTSDADLVITSVSEELELAKTQNLLAPMDVSDTLIKISKRFRDPDNYWTGFAYRLRSIFYDLKIAKPEIPRDYSVLVEPEWKGRICTRNLDQKYNYAMVSWLIESKGLEYASSWVSGLYQNMATEPTGRDKDQALKILEGKCEVAIANSYYFSELLWDDNTRKTAVNHLGIMLPNQKAEGAFPLVNGIAILMNSKNKELANQFIGYLLNYLSQKWLTDQPSFYPVRADVPVDAIVKYFGHAADVGNSPKIDQTPIFKIAPHFDQAKELIHKAGFVMK